jgi:predicted RNase H-like HicB family nuclease
MTRYIFGRIQEVREMAGIVVNATWDAEGKVWLAESDDVPGLATGADTLEQLIEKLKVAIPELLEENGLVSTGPLPFEIKAERSEFARVA